MWRFVRSPLVRISFGLAMLTVAMLLITDAIGLVPDTRNTELESRKFIAETLAVQLSMEIADQRLQDVDETLRSVVERNDIVTSAAVRKASGNLLNAFGDHDRHWTLEEGARSTPTQVYVPLYTEDSLWGRVELSFTALTSNRSLLSLDNSFTTVILFVALAGFIAYLLFLKRTLRELDPDSVIPERVRAALDTLAEGLLIVDQDDYIVFSNSAFARKIGLTPKDLVGKQSSKLYWETVSDGGELPWTRVLEGEELPKGVTVKLKTALKATYTFTVNASPIAAGAGKVRGVLVTFDDITEIEAKNQELRRALGKLEQSQLEVTRQNQKLQVLATRDPLTDILNRRAFFQGFDTLFAEACEEGGELSCIMTDIDHFKSVNDRFGHAVGDKVIKLLAKILTDHTRSFDLVGRIGGEEFCIVLPGVDAKVAARIAERVRLTVQQGQGTKFTTALRITSSFGVASLSDDTAGPKELLDRADAALYAAKEAGRNRVVSWSVSLADANPKDSSQAPAVEQILESAEQLPGEATPDDRDRSGGIEEDGAKGQSERLLSLPSQDDHLNPQHLEKDHRHEIELTSYRPEHMPNRTLLFDRIDQSIKRTARHDSQIALMVIDVDTLRRVNDTLGLAVGEKFAKVIVTRLKQTLRLTDTVAITEQDELLFAISQLGSNEIVVLLTDLQQAEIVTNIIQRIFASLKKPVTVEGQEFYIKVNVGVSIFPHDGDNPQTLIKNASSAMREAKKHQGHNNFRFYAEDINQRAEKQIRLESELHRALERDELTIYYQPKVDLKSGSILGMEALMRWQHPQFGIVPPNDFIPVAEQTGLIEEIGQWVIRTACRQIRFWQEAGYGTITVAVNLSPVEFRNPKLGDQIISILQEFGVPTGALEIEITETVVMQNIDTAVSILEKLSNAGFSISVDDFGTGYSSLSYLKRFPLSKVKIDRSFISDFMQGSSDAAIVSAIIAMSHSLGLRVVAEGVETEEQLRFLQDLHCDEMQGYLVSRPVPREEVNDLLAQASSIRRMILENGVDYGGLMHHQGVGAASGMIGVLNDFPEEGPPASQQSSGVGG